VWLAEAESCCCLINAYCPYSPPRPRWRGGGSSTSVRCMGMDFIALDFSSCLLSLSWQIIRWPDTCELQCQYVVLFPLKLVQALLLLLIGLSVFITLLPLDILFRLCSLPCWCMGSYDCCLEVTCS
jgi:hypothetical protein